MAKEKPCCVLCRQEIGLFGRYGIVFYRTSQTVCHDCQARYQKSAGPERDALDQRILASPSLENRSTVLRNYEEDKAKELAEAEKRRDQDQMALERRERQRAVLHCCDREMTPLGNFTFQLGEHTFFLGDLDNLLSGSLELALFRCNCCGQIKFFDPSFVKEISPDIPASKGFS